MNDTKPYPSPFPISIYLSHLSRKNLVAFPAMSHLVMASASSSGFRVFMAFKPTPKPLTWITPGFAPGLC